MSQSPEAAKEAVRGGCTLELKAEKPSAHGTFHFNSILGTLTQELKADTKIFCFRSAMRQEYTYAKRVRA